MTASTVKTSLWSVAKVNSTWGIIRQDADTKTASIVQQFHFTNLWWDIENAVHGSGLPPQNMHLKNGKDIEKSNKMRIEILYPKRKIWSSWYFAVCLKKMTKGAMGNVIGLWKYTWCINLELLVIITSGSFGHTYRVVLSGGFCLMLFIVRSALDTWMVGQWLLPKVWSAIFLEFQANVGQQENRPKTGLWSSVWV